MTVAPAAAPRRPLLVPGVRLLRVLWRMLPHVAACALALAAARLLGASAEVRDQVLVACGFVAGWSFLRAHVMEILSPQRPGLRVVPMEDATASRASATARALLAVLLATELLAWLLRANGARPSIAALLGIVRNAAIVLLGAAIVVFSRIPRALREAAGPGLLGLAATVVTRVLLPAAVPAGLAVAVAHGLGYEPLAAWIGRKLLATALEVLVAAVAFRWLRNGVREAMSLGRTVAGPAVEPSPGAVGLERILTGLLLLAVCGATGVWVLSTWELPPSRLADLVARPVLGSAALTWGRLLGGLAKVAAVVLAGRLLRTVLTFFVFPSSNVDVGARYAILAVLRYLVIALIVVYGLDALGLDVGSLAWFFGAAGIGVGLGLQDVIANFFSGLLMLFERPVRVGDLVEVGATTGTVEEVQMRGTLIRTAQNTTVLVPNRQMMSERLSNLSYGMSHGLVEVRVGVAYEADPARVEQALRDVAGRHPDVVLVPPPVARFLSFGPTALEFALYCHTSRVRERAVVASDLRFRIVDAFRREGIPLPTAHELPRLAAGAPRSRE